MYLQDNGYFRGFFKRVNNYMNNIFSNQGVFQSKRVDIHVRNIFSRHNVSKGIFRGVDNNLNNYFSREGEIRGKYMKIDTQPLKQLKKHYSSCFLIA